MTTAFRRSDSGIGTSISASLLVHLAIAGLFAWLQILHPFQVPTAPVYYVDVVNLPVADPQAGSSAAPPGKAPTQAAPQPAKSPPPEMKLPAKSAGKPVPAAKTAPPAVPEGKESASEFEERMNRLQQSSEARHAAAALDALRRKAAIRGSTPGIPGGTGKEAGSDYASYIRSRLVDAFQTTIAYQSKNPRIVMVLSIDRSGKVVKRRMESSSGDRLFEDSVSRAIIKAEKEFRPPPGGGTFEYGFIFSPKGVGEQ